METCYQALADGADDVYMGDCQFDAPLGRPVPLAYVTVLVCRQGSAEWEVNFQSYRMTPGDFLVLAEDSIARPKRSTDGFACAAYLMKRAIAAEVASGLPNRLFRYLSRNPFFTAEQGGAAFMAAWQALAAMLGQQCASHRRAMLVNHFQNLFLWICERTDALQAEASNDFSRPEAICWRFWELIGKHCRRQREVAFYADLLHITPYYLAQLSRKYFNDAPKTLIDRQVVLEIKKQLAQPGRSIQQIADALHFADASYLGKYFKRHTGTGLGERRKHQAAALGNAKSRIAI